MSGYDFKLGEAIHATPVGRFPEPGPTVDGLRDVRKIKSAYTLQRELCSMARYPVNHQGQKIKEPAVPWRVKYKLNLGACIECESPCAYGTELLRRMPIHELLELGCGEDCMKCQTGCRLYRLAVQKISEIELEKAIRERRAKRLAREALALARPPKEEEDP